VTLRRIDKSYAALTQIVAVQMTGDCQFKCRGAAMNSKYGFGKIVKMGFDEAVARVTQALQGEGFGVLTDIDVAATMKKKLSRDMPPYRILGACNPPLAHRAIQAEPSIGLLLPCNVVVRQDEGGAVHVELMDPIPVLSMVESPDIAPVATEIRQRLQRVMAAV